jgi:hypothetical protein
MRKEKQLLVMWNRTHRAKAHRGKLPKKLKQSLYDKRNRNLSRLRIGLKDFISSTYEMRYIQPKGFPQCPMAIYK